MGFLQAPPKPAVYMVYAGYGALTGSRSIGRARVWVLTPDPYDPDAPLTVRIGWNDPQTGAVVYEDVPGVIASIEARTSSMMAQYEDGSRVGFVAAPCVCGAGAVGMAGPMSGRHAVQFVAPDSNNRYRFIP
jgi:hypothetical protein